MKLEVGAVALLALAQQTVMAGEVLLPGQAIAIAVARRAGGGADPIVLVAPPAAEPAAEARAQAATPRPCPDAAAPDPRPPRHLVRVDLDAGSVVALRDDLPADANSLAAADLDGDGADEWLLSRPGAVLRIDGGRLEPLIEQRQGMLSLVLGRDANDAVRPAALGLHAGRMHVYGAIPTSVSWTALADVALPREARVIGSDLVVRHPFPQLGGMRADGAWLFLTRPQAVGRRRLRVESIAVSAQAPAEVVECWARLPEEEQVLESHFLMLEGRPVLLVTTKPADKLALFGEKRLRLYALAADRSRRGHDPLLAAESGMNLWQQAFPLLRDVDADGRADLVVGYWKGLAGDRVVLDSYLRAADGSFEKAARTTAFDVKDGDRSYIGYGQDLDGDGRADLLLQAQGRLWLYPGRASKSGTNLVATAGRALTERAGADADDVEIAVGLGAAYVRGAEQSAGPRIVDVDGDGRDDVLWVDPGAAKLSWLRLD